MIMVVCGMGELLQLTITIPARAPSWGSKPGLPAGAPSQGSQLGLTAGAPSWGSQPRLPAGAHNQGSQPGLPAGAPSWGSQPGFTARVHSWGSQPGLYLGTTTVGACIAVRCTGSKQANRQLMQPCIESYVALTSSSTVSRRTGSSELLHSP